jgi:hypothetical protein
MLKVTSIKLFKTNINSILLIFIFCALVVSFISATKLSKIHITTLDIINFDPKSVHTQSLDIESFNPKFVHTQSLDIETLDIESLDIETLDIEDPDLKRSYLQSIDLYKSDINADLNTPDLNIDNYNINLHNLYKILVGKKPIYTTKEGFDVLVNPIGCTNNSCEKSIKFIKFY